MPRSTVQDRSIITDGLIIYYDAANNRSYTGVTSSWTDLTINNNTATLYSGSSTSMLTYNTSYGGGFTFLSGSTNNNGGRFTMPYINLTTQSFAVDIWYTPKSRSSTEQIRGIIGCGAYWDTLTGTPGWGIGFSAYNLTLTWGISSGSVGNVTAPVLLYYGPILTIDKPYNIFLHRNTSDQQMHCYVNGVDLHGSSGAYGVKSIANTITLEGNRNPINSVIWDANGTNSPQGTLHSVKIYNNKNFTQDEVTQNYNALKSRFGL
jgi:hypothetical protein